MRCVARRQALTDVITDTLRKLLGNSTVDGMLRKFDSNVESYYARLPHDYGQEIAGIAKAAGMEPSVVFIYNIFYTVFGACTSVVAQARLVSSVRAFRRGRGTGL